MSVDTIANMLSIIKNATMVNKPFVEVMYTKECEGIANVLKAKGYLEGVKTFKEKGSSHKRLNLTLKYENGLSSITHLARVSKPSKRIYRRSEAIGRVRNGFGSFIISTNRGIIDDDEARRKKLGGEILCKVY